MKLKVNEYMHSVYFDHNSPYDGNMNVAHVMHGFNVDDSGKSTTDKLIPYLEQKGYLVVEHDYGHMDLAEVAKDTHKVVAKLVEASNKGDVFVGHSHAGAIFSLAVEKGANFRAAVLIHPALNANWIPPYHNTCHITVFYHWTDYATFASMLLRKLTMNKFLGNKRWGAAGSFGLKYSDSWVKSVKGAWFHSGGFRNIKKWGPRYMKHIPDSIIPPF